jgi:sortase B
MSKKVAFNIIIINLIFIAAASGFLFFLEYRKAKEEMLEYSTIQDQFTIVVMPDEPVIEEINDLNDEADEDAIPPETVGLPLVEVDFEALMQINPDTVGWIAIPNTPVSYPVVQATNNTKYLTSSFLGEYSRAGTPFADRNNNMQILDTNTIIYGHNMGTGRDDMFGTLLDYKDYEYYKANKYIQFDTVYQSYGFWRVFAVIEYDSRSNAFQHLQINFSDEDSFMDWIAQTRELSMHSVDIEILPFTRILTLSTCDRGNYGRDGRLLIIAAQMYAVG